MNDLRTATYKGLDRVAQLPYAVLMAILSFGVACLIAAGALVFVEYGINPIGPVEAAFSWITQLLVAFWNLIVDLVTSL
jgi:hypothetical protein